MSEFFDARMILRYLPALLSRVHITLTIVILATAAGLVLGTVVALIRMGRIPVLSQIAAVYLSFMRGTPIIVQLFIVYYGLPAALNSFGIDINQWDKFYFIVIAYSLNEGAFLSEIIRGAITGVDVGQGEAAYSVGLTKWQAFRRIVAPQALLTALPSFSVNIVMLLQNTSLGFTIGLVDVMGEVKAISQREQHLTEGYIAAAIIFVALSLILQRLFTLVEKRLQSKFAKAVG